MRANEILFEYKRDVTAKKMGMSLMRAAAYDSGIARGAPKDMIDNVLIALEEMDPSPTKKYVQWLAVQYTDRRFRSEDAGRVRDELLDIYAEFLDIKGYPPHLSANELYEDPSFREEDREWLDAFLDAWEEQDQ